MPGMNETKLCTRCNQTKPTVDFYRVKTWKDGLDNRCKPCRKEIAAAYRKSPVGHATFTRLNKAYMASERGKAGRRAYKKSPKGKAAQARYFAAYPLKKRAHDVVAYAVRLGKLPKVGTQKCECGQPARHYHHHKGYAPENHLAVIPVCTTCHHLLDNPQS